MEFKGFTLDTFQVEAIRCVDKGRSVIVSAPTGSGKTLIADYVIDKSIREKKRVIYTAPIKALSNQKYKDFTEEYGEDKIGLVTGDIVINPDAQILIMTTEVYRNMAIIKDSALESVSYCIMDEIHFISDEERGYVWEESIIFSPENIRFLFLSATIPNAEEFSQWVSKIKGGNVDVIRYDIRPVPLEIMFYDADLGISSLRKIKELKDLDDMPRYKHMYSRKQRRQKVKVPEFTGLIKELGDRLPCIYFVFSRAKTQQYATTLAKKEDFLSSHEKAQVAGIIQGSFRKVSKDVQNLDSTHILRDCLTRGIAFHHAGLLPDVKHIVEKLFGQGLIKVLFATETFAVGINMPAKTVCFDSLRKFTGTGFRYLNTKEFFQISGRAGRRGMDKSGLSVSVIHRPSAEFQKIKDVTSADMMPLKSQFRLSYNTVLNMVNLHTQDEIDKILKMNFYTFQKLGQDNSMLAKVNAEYQSRMKTLTRMGYVQDGKLTEIGVFTTRIYSDELELSQIFMGGLRLRLDEYNVLALIAALAYEAKREVRFFKTSSPGKVIQAVKDHPYLKSGKWVRNIQRLTAVVDPLFRHKSFIDILSNTNMTEGDLMRLLMQMLDRLEQIDRAIIDHEQTAVVRNCKHLIRDCLSGIGVF